VAGYTLFPHAMAFGKLPESEGNAAIGAFAEILAREASEVGIQITFGPVADVNTNPRNPIIATRAFGEDPQRVAELVAAYVKVVQSAGLLATAKHFPGHGHTDEDSHETLPSVGRSLGELEACEFMPFQAAIDARCALIMTAHVAYSAVDSSETPATLSPAILQKLLRDEMGFAGAVCSDSLLMAGVRERFETEGQMALAVLQAGVDLLLDVEDAAAVVDYLCQCVFDDRLAEARVDQALSRLWALKQFASQQVSWQEFGRINTERVARGAITITQAASSTALPLKPDEPLVAILLKPFEIPLDPPEQPLGAALRERFRDVRYRQLGPNADPAAFEAARQLAQGARQLLIAVIVRPAAWHAFGLQPEQSEFVGQLVRSRPVVLASLGVPYVLDDYPEAAVRICGYSDVPVSQQALAQFLVTPN
jgi:beta-glucosidase-like glycosyl hydrolase